MRGSVLAQARSSRLSEDLSFYQLNIISAVRFVREPRSPSFWNPVVVTRRWISYTPILKMKKLHQVFEGTVFSNAGCADGKLLFSQIYKNHHDRGVSYCVASAFLKHNL